MQTRQPKSLDPLVTTSGDVASAYLRSPSALDDAEHQFLTRWKNTRRMLESQGAPGDVLAEFDRLIEGIEHHEGAALAMFVADGGATVYHESMDDDLVADVARYDSLPVLTPLVETRQRSVPHVMVVTDRTGADLIAVASGETEEVEVDGEELHVQRSAPGGWSQRRFQQRAENTWESNAGEVAEQVNDLARDIGARTIVIAGDVRASNLLLERLDHEASEVAHLIEAGTDEAIAEATVKSAADVVARDTTSVIERFREQNGSGSAASGAEAVLTALTAGQVETLLVHDDVDVDTRVYFTPGDSPACSITRSDDGMSEGRLVDVAVRSALLTDAEIRVVPKTIVGDDGLAAILRW